MLHVEGAHVHTSKTYSACVCNSHRVSMVLCAVQPVSTLCRTGRMTHMSHGACHDAAYAVCYSFEMQTRRSVMSHGPFGGRQMLNTYTGRQEGGLDCISMRCSSKPGCTSILSPLASKANGDSGRLHPFIITWLMM